MTNKVHHPDLSLSLLAKPRDPLHALADRARIVLETRPGTLPYARELGCDLDELSAGAATDARLSEVQARVRGALVRWLPQDVQLATCQVEAREAHAGGGGADVPVAERVLASTGASVALDVRLVLRTADGPVTLDAQLDV